MDTPSFPLHMRVRNVLIKTEDEGPRITLITQHPLVVPALQDGSLIPRVMLADKGAALAAMGLRLLGYVLEIRVLGVGEARDGFIEKRVRPAD